MMKYSKLEEDENIEENIIKNVKNIFKLKELLRRNKESRN